ncbi:MAG: hypothetical protein IJM92_07260 [Fibrobacter sp.]|uniref:hypothetical protein n=1 Tax=Fibrobacter sp. TaxID=35828 RepID=UPI001B439A38|nr:hypothetical protein [Fibrobacter sp.]MBP5440888.1 hypothetical protein [Fibrobacter sp.]MBQ3716417.1 hypothetical protein [Fibrobacter sp.]MBQ7079449.1 hypothetical protein [Fibrobacter sp.]
MANKIDFSKLERLTPRDDSWAKVCARLDAESASTPAKGKIIDIKSWYSAIPIAASLVLVSLTALLPAITDDVEGQPITTETISINSSAPDEVSSWYSSLGNSTSDEFETLEETVGFSYLIKE